MRRLFSLALGLIVAGVPCALAAATEIDTARELVVAKKYPEAKAVLAPLIAAEPKNAEARHALGIVYRQERTVASYEEGLKWLTQAADLEPTHAEYVSDMGLTSLELGAMLQKTSFTKALGFATRGRDLLEKSLTLDPANLDAHEALFQFYTQAPWPIGSSSKAKTHLAEITKRNPTRGLQLAVLTKMGSKDYADAFKLCEDVLAKNPNDYLANFLYGRTASMSGKNLERGLTCLQKAATLTPPPNVPFGLSAVWYRTGHIHETLNHPAEARTAYTTALKHDPQSKPATEGLARLK